MIMGAAFTSILEQAGTDAAEALTFSPVALLEALAVAIALGFALSLVYMKTHKAQPPSQSLSVTLVALPAVITIIILLVGSNFARAFSIAGVFSIIRFRSTPGDPKDIMYVLFATAVGLACGMGYLLYAVLAAVLLCLLLFCMSVFGYGRVQPSEKLLRITLPENLDYEGAFDGIFAKYTLSCVQQRVRTIDLGSLYEVNYLCVLKPGVKEKAFIDEIRVRNGNLNISLSVVSNKEE